MLNWSQEQLAQRLADNPALRINEKYSLKRKKGAPSTRAESLPVRSEDDEQIEVAQVLDSIIYQGRPLRWCHVPNGGKRSKREAVRFQKMGVKPGVPDIAIFDPPPICPSAKGAWIEMKRVSGGKLSDYQKDWLNYLESSGWLVARCDGAAAAIRKLREWGYL